MFDEQSIFDMLAVLLLWQSGEQRPLLPAGGAAGSGPSLTVILVPPSPVQVITGATGTGATPKPPRGQPVLQQLGCFC